MTTTRRDRLERLPLEIDTGSVSTNATHYVGYTRASESHESNLTYRDFESSTRGTARRQFTDLFDFVPYEITASPRRQNVFTELYAYPYDSPLGVYFASEHDSSITARINSFERLEQARTRRQPVVVNNQDPLPANLTRESTKYIVEELIRLAKTTPRPNNIDDFVNRRIFVTGSVGCGKTMWCNNVLSQYEDSHFRPSGVVWVRASLVNRFYYTIGIEKALNLQAGRVLAEHYPAVLDHRDQGHILEIAGEVQHAFKGDPTQIENAIQRHLKIMRERTFERSEDLTFTEIVATALVDRAKAMGYKFIYVIDGLDQTVSYNRFRELLIECAALLYGRTVTRKNDVFLLCMRNVSAAHFISGEAKAFWVDHQIKPPVLEILPSLPSDIIRRRINYFIDHNYATENPRETIQQFRTKVAAYTRLACYWLEAGLKYVNDEEVPYVMPCDLRTFDKLVRFTGGNRRRILFSFKSLMEQFFATYRWARGGNSMERELIAWIDSSNLRDTRLMRDRRIQGDLGSVLERMIQRRYFVPDVLLCGGMSRYVHPFSFGDDENADTRIDRNPSEPHLYSVFSNYHGGEESKQRFRLFTKLAILAYLKQAPRGVMDSELIDDLGDDDAVERRAIEQDFIALQRLALVAPEVELPFNTGSIEWRITEHGRFLLNHVAVSFTYLQFVIFDMPYPKCAYETMIEGASLGDRDVDPNPWIRDRLVRVAKFIALAKTIFKQETERIQRTLITEHVVERMSASYADVNARIFSEQIYDDVEMGSILTRGGLGPEWQRTATESRKD